MQNSIGTNKGKIDTKKIQIIFMEIKLGKGLKNDNQMKTVKGDSYEEGKKDLIK